MKSRERRFGTGWAAALSFLVLCSYGVLCMDAQLADARDLPAQTRQLVLARSGNGYGWRLDTAQLPAVGAHQVLIQVHAAALNHGELELLGPDGGDDRSGFVVARMRPVRSLPLDRQCATFMSVSAW